MTKYVHPLTEAEVEALRQQHRKTREASVRSRCEMILLSHEGLSPAQIAERVRLSDRTVRRVIDRYETDGIKGLSNKAIPGRPPRVTAAYLEQLEHAVEHNPRELGLPFSNWTTANIAAYMAQQTGITIGARQMENYLKAQRWRLRRPVLSVKPKQDQAQVTEKKNHV
jgi:transposase